jgi:hypothetical protein
VAIDDIETEGVIDTGGAYLILDPEMADSLDLDASNCIGRERVGIRGVSYPGGLYRIDLTFLSEAPGSDVTVTVTAFVPDLDVGEPWVLPVYLGWFCCIERLRFAIDPANERFHFGSPDDTY